MRRKDIIVSVLMLCFMFVTSSYGWYSKDPAVFDKLKGTAWEIFYHCNYTDIVDGIGFYDDISPNDDGEACLFTWNIDGWPGMTLYGDKLIGSGYGFTAILADKMPTPTKSKCLMFDIDGNSLSGDFMYMNMLTENIQTSKLYGHKLGKISRGTKLPDDMDTKGLFDITPTINPNNSESEPVVSEKKDDGNPFGCFIQEIKEASK